MSASSVGYRPPVQAQVSPARVEMRVKSQGQRGQSPGLTAVNPEAHESEGQTLSPRLRYRAQCSLGIDVGVHQVGLDAVDLGEYLVSQGAVLAGSSLPPPHLPQEYLPSVAEGARVRLAGAHPLDAPPERGGRGPTAVGGGGSALQPRCPQGVPAW